MPKWLTRLFTRHFSIKSLTLLGFGFVAIPLVFAFLYSAQQVNHLSQQGTAAIFDVAGLVESNRKISQLQARAERFAGQFLVLNEVELLQSFRNHSVQLIQTMNIAPTLYNDPELTRTRQLYTEQLQHIEQAIGHNKPAMTLAALQQEFRTLAELNQDIALRSNQLIDMQANKMQQFAEQIKQTMLLSLYIIPITVLVAIVFILLITRPLNTLQAKIQRLERGNLQHPINLRGSAEVVEIAQALERMRCRLHELELQKSSFIRHISHELKTPLAAIREGTELIYDNSVGELNQAQQEITDIIRRSVSRLQTLIEDLLDFNIVLDSTSLQDAQIVDINDLLDKTIEQRHLDIARKNLQISRHIDTAHIQCNDKQLNVVLDNLLSNAIKFSPERGVITIRAWQEQGLVNISIKDQGPGISPTLYNKVFTAFYQGDTQHNSPIKSSGLGLTIVKELLMRMQGTVHIDSRTESPSYCQFTLQLPFNKQQLVMNSTSVEKRRYD